MSHGDAIKPKGVGVVNPFALVETKLKHRVDWRRMVDHRKLVEAVIGVPYEKLFDPMHGSPLYPELRYDVQRKQLVRDEKIPSVADLHSSWLKIDRLSVSVGGYNLSGESWIDPGQFFTDPTDVTDPVQGAIPDCHFVAALASLAWTRPDLIGQRSRPLRDKDSFPSGGGVDMIRFYSGTGAAPQEVEVTELLPLIEPGNVYQYARSSDPGETWPAVYEKAWVKFVTNDHGDKPDYTKIGGGDPIADLVALTGMNPHYKSTQGVSAHDIYQEIRAHSRGGDTFDPMAAWTYASASDAPTPINYSNANLVAWHIYSILGWQYDAKSGQEYIVLRNPWGNTEATLNTDNGPWTMINESFMQTFDLPTSWRTFNLPQGGIFALRADTFQQYFAGYGWVD
jgi:hypothetical protein